MATTATAERKLLLDGEWIETGEWVEIASPYDGSLVARVAKAGAAEARAAVDAAPDLDSREFMLLRRDDLHVTPPCRPSLHSDGRPPRNLIRLRSPDFPQRARNLILSVGRAGPRTFRPSPWGADCSDSSGNATP